MKNNITGRVPLAIICQELQGVITSKKESKREMKWPGSFSENVKLGSLSQSLPSVIIQ